VVVGVQRRIILIIKRFLSCIAVSSNKQKRLQVWPDPIKLDRTLLMRDGAFSISVSFTGDVIMLMKSAIFYEARALLLPQKV
jgi:hypothetical protein